MPRNTKAGEGKKEIAKKAVSKKEDVKGTNKKSAPKKTTTKKTSVTKKVSTKKTTSSKAATAKSSKESTAKKSSIKTTKKATKSTSKTSVSSKAKKSAIKREKKSPVKSTKIPTLEYYDLPYRYNQTVVKILAQTPTTLFVYWDISDTDREKFVKEFGENFFNDTYPVLIVHNKTKNYSFEIEVNDFANSWYFNVSDTKCDYEIEFGRRKKAFTQVSIPNDYIYITSSNIVEAPNDRILFEPKTKTLFFRNVKTNKTFYRDVSTFSYMERLSRIYNIYDIYKQIYKEEEFLDVTNNPASSGSSSVFYKKD